MTTIHLQDGVLVTLKLSTEAFEVLQDLQRKEISPDRTVESMILAFKKCQSKPAKE